MNASPKGYGDRGPRPDSLTEMDRRNLRALLFTMYRREGTWIKVAHLLAFRRDTVKGFYDGKNEGGIALARTIARAVDLDLEAALDGRFIITAKNEIIPLNVDKRNLASNAAFWSLFVNGSDRYCPR